MNLIAPHRICNWLGHKRESYMAGYYTDRRDYQRERRHSRCTRCGTSDGGTVYEPGRLEYLRPQEIRRAYRRFRLRFTDWWRQDCDDCRKPMVRCGRNVGKHEDCDVIPF